MNVPKEFADKEIVHIKQLSKDKKSIDQIRTELNVSRCQLCKERQYGLCVKFSERAIGFKLFKTGVITKKQLDSHLAKVETRKKEIKNEKRRGIEKKRAEILQLKEVCEICGSKTKLEVHHIIPVAENGTHELENLIVLCGPCHKLLTKNRHYTTKGYLKWETPITPQEMKNLLRYESILQSERDCKLIKVLDGSRKFFRLRVEKINTNLKDSGKMNCEG
jgi:5-methylcytosine-specific restriction endonuclease McrA